MPVDEELECAVCFHGYSRWHRIPRMLHCDHTFCAPCLDAMSRPRQGIRVVTCPLCRWITCAHASYTLTGALWVNTDIWDRISSQDEQERMQSREEEEDNALQEWIRSHRNVEGLHAVSSASSPVSFKSTMKKLLRFLCGTSKPSARRPEERLVITGL